jgi:hypothetical protein
MTEKNPQHLETKLEKLEQRTYGFGGRIAALEGLVSARDKKKLWGMTKSEAIMAALTVIGLGIAVLTGLIFWRQLDAMKADQRAWVVVKPKTVPMAAIVNQPLQTVIRLTNTGKTPARNVVASVFVEVVQNGKPINFDYSSTRFGPRSQLVTGELFPNDNADMDVIRKRPKQGENEPENELVNDSEATQLLSGNAYISIHGMVTYDDVFKISHWKTFCIWQPMRQSSSYTAFECTEHNSEDAN